MTTALKATWQEIKVHASSYGALFFLGSPYLAVVLLALTLIHVNIGFAGLIGIASTALLMHLLRVPAHSALASATQLNSLLTAMLIGDLFVVDIKVATFIFSITLLNLVIVSVLSTWLNIVRLPGLSLTFSISAILILFLAPQLTFFADATVYFAPYEAPAFMPPYLALFFKSISSIFCTPDVMIGIAMWLAIFFTSPLTGLFLAAGFFLGTVFESILHATAIEDMRYQEGFNYALIFTGLAGYFLIPSRFSLLVASLAVAMTPLLLWATEILLRPWHLQPMALPFNIVSLSAILAIRHIRPWASSVNVFETPELSIEHGRLAWQRHHVGEPGVFLPVKGRWLVQQGFNGKLTHKGHWQHAIDLVCVDQAGQIFKNKGIELTDHFTFDQDVLSPIQGTVIASLKSEKDNLIGQVANTGNWGNYLVIRAATGLCVTLAHLKKDSIKLNIGDFVDAGQVVAKAGNSGYSQEPHLHLQVQWSGEVGAYTAPFHLLNFGVGQNILFHATPKEGEVLRSLSHNQAVEKILNFKVAEELKFKKAITGSSQSDEIIIKALVDELTGAFYLTDGVSKLYFAKVGWQFYFYDLIGSQWSPLWDLFAAAPKFPMIYGEPVRYQDAIPIKLGLRSWQRLWASVAQLLTENVKSLVGHYEINEQGLEIQGECPVRGKNQKTFIKIDPVQGIERFTVGNTSYVRQK